MEETESSTFWRGFIAGAVTATAVFALLVLAVLWVN